MNMIEDPNYWIRVKFFHDVMSRVDNNNNINNTMTSTPPPTMAKKEKNASRKVDL